MGELRSTEIYWVVSSYIGVEGGYLGDFTYRTHKEFYSAYCDVDLDPEAFPGNTTRERFIAVLKAAPALTQAAILRGIARKYPVGTEHQRTASAYQKLLALAKRCPDGLSVEAVSPQISSELLQRALTDAATLMGTSGPTHAVDRVHTAMHAYLKAVCRAQGIEIPPNATITNLFKLLRQEHPRLHDLGPQPDTMTKVLSSLSNVMDCLNPARNNASLAHANDELLERDEACLVINSARTIFQYLDAKLR